MLIRIQVRLSNVFKRQNPWWNQRSYSLGWELSLTDCNYTTILCVCVCVFVHSDWICTRWKVSIGYSAQSDSKSINLLTPKIWLLILPSSCYTFPCKLITRIWCSIKVISCTWWVWVFSLPVCWIMYGYYRKKLPVNHFRELNG